MAESSSFFESISVTSTTLDADADVVYTVPPSFDAEITFLTCTNGSATNTISIEVYHDDDSSYHHLLRSHSIHGNDTYELLTSTRIFLHAGDKVVAYKGGGTMDVSISGRLTYNPRRT